MSKKKDSLKPWLSRPAVNRSVTLPLTRPLTQRLSNLNEFHPNELDPYLLFDARDSMVGTLENPTLDLDPSKPDTLNVITATRSGTATYTDVNGNIATAAADTVRVDYTQGEELTPTKFQRIGYTDFSSGVTLDGVIKTNQSTPYGDGVLLTQDSSSGEHNINISVTSTGQHTFSLKVKPNGVTKFSLSLEFSTSNSEVVYDTAAETSGIQGSNVSDASIENLGDGWFLAKLTNDSAVSTARVRLRDNSSQVNYLGDGASGLFLTNPQVEEGTTASDFVENTTGSPKFITGATYGPRVPMILVEPSATNSFLYSQPTSALAFGGGAIRTFDAATAPNGETEAFRITNNGTSGYDNFRATSPITFGSDFMVLSVWAKAGSGGNNYFTWSFQNLGGAVVRAGFKLEGDGETQLITSGNGGHTLQIETHPDGWYRCIIIGNTQSSGATTQFLYTVSAFNEQSSIDGGSVLLWGFQLEEGSVATSYIPTSGGDAAARTRQADDLVISGSDFTDFYNATEGTVYTEAIGRGYFNGNTVFAFNSGNSSNDSIYQRSPSNNQVLVVINSTNGGLQAQLGSSGSVVSTGTLVRRAASFKLNNFKGSQDGVDTLPDTSGTIPTIDRLRVGASPTGLNQLNGHIKRLIYWPYHSDSL